MGLTALGDRQPIGGRRRGAAFGGAAWLVVALVGAVLVGAGPLVAAPSSDHRAANTIAPNGLKDLGEVRERLSRRSALHRFLSGQVDRLALEIEDLVLRRDEIAGALSETKAATRNLERELDRLVPRLLVRAAALRERRDRAGRALVELAAMSRQVQLDATLRARMLAISPVLLARLRGAEASVAALENARERIVDRHKALEARSPLLLGEQQRLERQREEKKDWYHALLARLERLDVELVGLQQVERRLAEAALHDEWARTARAEPQADEPALAIRRLARHDPTDLALKGLATQADDLSAASLTRVAVASGNDPLAKPSLLDRTRFDVLPPAARPISIAIKGHLADEPPAGSHDAASPAAYNAPLSGAAPDHRRPVARLPEGSRIPLLPAPGRAVDNFDAASAWRDDQGITIRAEPGQPVAAPEDGRVVFADRFKAYGWLLIIEHDSEYHTLLWGFSRLDVGAGDRVATGQIVGVVGQGEDQPPTLHVELRRQGRPVNPLPWLAASSSKVRG